MKTNRIICCPDCGGEVTIQSTNPVADTFTNSYCQCKNESCLAETVHSIYFSHYLTPPRNQLSQEALSALTRLPISERQQLSKSLGGR
ncbi:ogr/Delta-like zinc finger family protein [Citrobacter braakii]|uniref:ogr/Delta-like zinc finger family protein n=1 Tax=Citrobacter braakii TaxID=57706 RepID=UPI00351D7C42